MVMTEPPLAPTSPNTDGPEALAIRGTPHINHIRWSGVEFTQDNLYHSVTARRAHDLFAPGATSTRSSGPVPPGATATAITLSFDIDGAEAAQDLEIRPPCTAKIQQSRFAPLILAWLATSPFNLALSLGLLLLATLSALAPDLDTTDADDDDDEPRRAIRCPA
jgi:hypothetical protein